MLDALAVVCVIVAAAYVLKRYLGIGAKKGSCGCSASQCSGCSDKAGADNNKCS